MGLESLEIKLLITILLVPVIASQKCPTEYSVRNNGSRGEVGWKYGFSTSDPACLSKDENILTRICANGTWIPKETPKCHYVRSNLICPSNFIELDDYCVYLTNLRTFDMGCPYPANYYMNETKISVPVPTWLPIKRKSVVGNFEYTILGNLYGQQIGYNELPECKKSSKNCVVYFNKTMSYADCNSSYAHLCFYKKSYFELTNTLGTVVCENCGYSDLLRNKTFDAYLKFDYEKHELLLFLYSPNLISHFTEIHENSLACFTDSTGNLRQKLELTEKYKSNARAFYVYEVELICDLIGTYWCEYSTISNSTIAVTNKITAYKSYKGNEFAMRLRLQNDFCLQCNRISKDSISNYINQSPMKHIFGDRYKIRIMKAYKTVKLDVDVLIHISANKKSNIIGEYYNLKRLLSRLRDANLNVTSFRSAGFCMPLKDNLTWDLSTIGTIVLPKELCVDDRNLPIARRCAGDFLNGAYWAEPEGHCSRNFNPSKTTEIIHQMQFKNFSASDLKSLNNVYKNFTNLNVYDIQYTTNILNRLLSFNNATMDDEIVECVNNLMNVNKTILKESQLLLNSTDRMLNIVEEMYSTGNDTKYVNKLSLVIKKNLIVQISYPNINNVSGIAIYSKKNRTLRSNIIGLGYDDNLDNIDKTDLVLMVIVPKEVVQNINGSVQKVAIIVYLSDNFFSSETGIKGHSKSPIISVVIPGHGSILRSPIFIYYRNNNNKKTNLTDNHCTYWRYGLESESKQGYWSTSGGNLDFVNSNFIGCSYTHLSHFALLIMSQEPEAEDSFEIFNAPYFGEEVDTNERVLDIIALTGCILSLGGVLGIFLTAIVFRQWREKIGSKILLELSVTISLEILMVQLSDMELSDTICIIIGVFLHYVVIAKFCWMLVSALLQYMRFVKILGRLPNNLLLKANLFGWGLPTIPVTFVIIFAEDSYINGDQNFCYPTGLALYLGVLLPAIVVLVTNMLIYMQVMHNIIRNRLESTTEIKNVQKLQICLAILLFFLLGIPWIFGILGEFFDNFILRNIFMYLFCLTATIQGFVLFIFYVILDKSTRKLWINFFNKIFI